MSKKRYLISVLILCLFIIFFCFISTKNETTIINSNIIKRNEKQPIELPIARLVIKDINIDKNIYNYNSQKNTVEKNIQLLRESILPKDNNSIIFLAAHSGNSNISYFERLDELNNNSIIEFYYKDDKYVYKVKKVFEEDKDGDIEINKDYNNQLVLTTCSPTNKDKQLIVNSNLIKKEKV